MVDIKARERQLKARLAELDGRLHRIEDHLEAAPNPDWEDNAIESEMDEVVEGLGLAGLNEVEAIRAALARIASGTFGTCLKCGEAISQERLDVLPHTPICRNCARDLAKK